MPKKNEASAEGVQFSEADGHHLAADMLREIKTEWRQRWDACEVLTRKMTDDDAFEVVSGRRWQECKSAILRRYLGTVAAKGSPALADGFFAVLTEFIGSSLDEEVGVPSPDIFDRTEETE